MYLFIHICMCVHICQEPTMYLKSDFPVKVRMKKEENTPITFTLFNIVLKISANAIDKKKKSTALKLERMR